jgi:uncharacterized protein YjbI with pentapeptide repeats
MPADYSGQNLRGRSFKGQNLEGVDFSGADIRGVDFTGANLKGANFSHTTAGLQKRWATLLVLLSGTVAAISGFFSASIGYLVLPLFEASDLNAQITSLIIIIAIIVYFLVTIRQGIQGSLRVYAIAIAVFFFGMSAIVGAGYTAFNSIIVGVATITAGGIGEALGLTGLIALALAGAISFTIAIVGAVVFAITIAIAILTTITEVFAIAIAITFFFAVIGSVALGLGDGVHIANEKVVQESVARAVAVVVPIAFSVILLSSYISWQALKRNEKYALIRNITIAFAAIGGTSFRNADLTDADFTQATLKSTDFRKANLTRTCFRQVKKLDRVRPGTSYLQYANLRQVLTTGQGQSNNFDRFDLRGVNFQKAYLSDASFIAADLSNASFQDADLSRAKLVQAQLDATDFTGATLTGAYVEDWNITSQTNFTGVRCQYIYMRLPTKDNPDPWRKPDNREEVFADGEFGDFIKPIIDTLDLYHSQGIDPRAIATAFKQLAEDNPNAELEIVAIERRGEDKILLRAKTAVTANKSELSKEYFINYNQLKALAEREFRELIASQNVQISRLENMITTALERPSFYAQTYNNQGDTTMTGDRNIHMGSGNYNEQIKGSYIQGNYYAAGQPQSLAQAAAEIQALLKQLEQTYPTTTTSQQMIVAAEAINRIESSPTMKQKVINAVKEGGLAAFEKAIDNPAGAFVVGAIKGWQEIED